MGKVESQINNFYKILVLAHFKWKKKLGAYFMVQVGFWINDPSRIGRFHQQTLQFEDFAVKNFFHFCYMHIVVKKSWIGIKCIFYECWKKKNKKKNFAEKNHSVFKGFKEGPSNTLKLFFCKMCKMCFYVLMITMQKTKKLQKRQLKQE